MNDFSWPSAPLGVVILHGSCASLQMWLSFSIFVFHFYSWFFLFFFGPSHLSVLGASDFLGKET